MNDMSVTVNPVGSTTLPPEITTPANGRAKSTPVAAPVTEITDTIHLRSAGQSAVLDPQQKVLRETDTHAQLVEAALSGDPVARSLLNALASIPPPEVP